VFGNPMLLRYAELRICAVEHGISDVLGFFIVISPALNGFTPDEFAER